MTDIRGHVGLFLFSLALSVTQRCATEDPVQQLFNGKQPYDVNYDWAKDFASKNCTFAKRAAFKPPPSCPPPRTPVNRTLASQLGWRFAPILYQHPLEDSFLTDPTKWMAEATQYETKTWQALENNRVPLPSDEAGVAVYEYLYTQSYIATRLATPSYNFSASKVSFKVDDGPTIKRKAVIDPVVNGRLTGKVYYTVFRPFNDTTGEVFPHAWVYTYHLFYPWNGCSSQVVGTQVDQKKQGVEYVMCPDGIHEGDLEHVKVWVCEDDMLNDDPSTAVRRAQYSQHGWLPDFDCMAGECNWETDDEGIRRIVTYAGLGSHSNYPWESPLYVYAKVRLDLLLNMDGLYIGDRYKKGPVWYPKQDTVLFLPFMSEMTREQLRGEYRWAIFPGTWGATIDGKDRQRTIVCLYDNHTRYGPCNITNPAYYILDVLVNPIGYNWTDITYIAKTSGNTVTGPLWKRTFAYNWEREREAPYWTDAMSGPLLFAGDGLCPLEANITFNNTGKLHFGKISIADFLGAVVGIMMASAVITVAMVLPVLLCRRDKPCFLQRSGSAVEPPATPHPSVQALPTDAPPGIGFKKGVNVGEHNPGSTPDAQVMIPEGVAALDAIAAAADATDKGKELRHDGSSEQNTTVSITGGGHDGGGYTVVAEGDERRAVGVTSVGVTMRGMVAALQRAELRGIRLSHAAILETFSGAVLQPYMLAAWVFVGVSLFICGVVLGALGVADCRKALDRVLPLWLWGTLVNAVKLVLLFFGVVHLFVILASLCVRPTCGMLFGCSGGKLPHLEALRQSWRAHAVLVGLMVIEIHVSMLLFAFGLMMWIARYGVSEACVAALSTVFNLAYVVADVCVDLSAIGIDRRICGADLTNLCNIWSDLNVDFLSYGAMLFIIAQVMFMVLATTNYVTMRTSYVARRAIEREEREAEERLYEKQYGKSYKPSYWSRIFAGGSGSSMMGRHSNPEQRAKSAPAGMEAGSERQMAKVVA